MSHGLQVIQEIELGDHKKWITIPAGTTRYIPLSNASMWDTVQGIRFFLKTHWLDAGGGSLTITVEGANVPDATSWSTITTSAITPAAGTNTAPTESQFEVAPIVAAAASHFTSLPPYLRLKAVTNATATAAIHQITRTVRGLV